MRLPARIVSELIAGGIAAALLFYGFGRLDGVLGAHDAAITANSEAQLALHPALLRWRAKLAAAESRLAALGALSHRQADALRQALATGQRVDTVVVLQDIARQDSTAYARCSLALTACEQRAASADQEADSLTARLTAQLRVHDRRWGLFVGGGFGTAGLKPQATISVGYRLWP